MATDKQVKYVQSLQTQYNIEKYTEEQIRNMSHQEITDVVDEFKKYKVEKNYKVTSNQVELIMEIQDEAGVKWYNRRQVKKFTHQEIESLVIKLKNEVEINEMNRKAWKDQVNMWKEFEWLLRKERWRVIGATILTIVFFIIGLIFFVAIMNMFIQSISKKDLGEFLFSGAAIISVVGIVLALLGM